MKEARKTCEELLKHIDSLSEPEQRKAFELSFEISLASRPPSAQMNKPENLIHRADSLNTVVKDLDNYKSVANVTVDFGFDKAKLDRRTTRNKLDQFAQTASECQKSYIIEVTGGTDSAGSAAYNYDLSNRRADAVVQIPHRSIKSRHTAFT